MKKNSIRLAKLEDSLIKGEPELFELSYFELLERIEELMREQGKKPTQKFLDEKKKASRSRPTFTPKQYEIEKSKEADSQARYEEMSNEEILDDLNKLREEQEMDEKFEDMSEQEINEYNNLRKEAVA